MKIKRKSLSYDEVMKIPAPKHKNPKRPSFVLNSLIRVLAGSELKKVNFRKEENRMELAGKGPWLILMNHSSFIDLEIVSKIMYPKPYNIVCTSDGFVGKEWLMRSIGCIPTKKFVSDIGLISDMEYALKKKKQSVLMYPEASYSFDGCATPLPRRLGLLIKKLGVPVISIHTEGAFARDPLYNNLQKRKVDVFAKVTCLFTAEETQEKEVAELDAMLEKEFTFDNFAWQYENKVEVTEPFRADGLHRILFRCAHCGKEGEMEGKGTHLICKACGKKYELDKYGRLAAEEGETEFCHVPDWYKWERECVRDELQRGEYRLDTDVEIGIMKDYRAIYMVGEGRLLHTNEGFVLKGCDGRLEYVQKPLASYSLYSDYYWYEIGDVICIGDKDTLYYCFPKKEANVAKARMAAEELYKLKKHRRSTSSE